MDPGGHLRIRSPLFETGNELPSTGGVCRYKTWKDTRVREKREASCTKKGIF